MKILSVFIAAILILTACMACGLLGWWMDHLSSIPKMNKMKFKSFVSFYQIAPGKWGLQDDYVVYYKSADDRYSWKKDHRFTFSFLDLIRYTFWRRSLDKTHEERELYEDYREAIESIRSDVENFQKENHVLRNKR